MKKPGHIDKKSVVESDLFDGPWYKNAYPDVALSKIAPIDHFMRFGLTLDRDPGPQFCTTFYRHAVDRDFLDIDLPLIHYLKHPDATPDEDLVLKAVMQVLMQGHTATARGLADRYLPPRLQHTMAALDANIAHLAQATDQWQAAINCYLDFNDLAPLILRPADDVLGRLHCGALPKVATGPLISVIMPVWNAEKTVATAINSLLEQTWQPLEIIAIDDASTDNSWSILHKIAARDDRIKLLRNACNVGPYVSKNLGLAMVTGAYITGHDADDWAHPERLAAHMRFAISRPDPLPVSMPYCLRMQSDGFFAHVRRAGAATSYDGWMQSAPIGTLFETAFLRENLGYWDSIRFGADTEMLLRARHVLGSGPLEIPLLSMICLDAPDSLSNNTLHGTRSADGRLSQSRRTYLGSVRDWLLDHPTQHPALLSFPQKQSRYAVSKAMQVSIADVTRNIVVNRNQ
jgi:hypothetical protein